MTPVESDFLVLFHDLARAIRAVADQRARKRGLTRAQWIILMWLESHPGLSQNELAAVVEVEPITVGRLVDRLEARGLVERRADPKDRRVWRLQLTPAADLDLREIESFRVEARDLVTAGIDPTALNVVMETLMRMKANLSAETRETGKSATANTHAKGAGANVARQDNARANR